MTRPIHPAGLPLTGRPCAVRRPRVQVTDTELDYTRQLLGPMTFGDVHKRSLQSDGRSSPNPFTRVLHFQHK